MRDPKRIGKIIEVLRAAWMAHPDMRLGQLISNCTGDENTYFIEDDEMEKELVKYASHASGTIPMKG